MIRQSYSDFVSLFGYLNPYELNHFSESFLVKLEELLLNRNNSEILQFSQQDVEHAIIRSMRHIQVELAESKMEEAQQQLERAKVTTFTTKKVTESSIRKSKGSNNLKNAA